MIAGIVRGTVAGIDESSGWPSISYMEGEAAKQPTLPQQRRSAALLAQLRSQAAGGMLENLQRIAHAGAAAAQVSATARQLGAEAAMDMLADRALQQDPPRALHAWLWKVARNQALTAARKERLQPAPEKSIPDAEWFAERPELLAKLKPNLQRAVEGYTNHRTLHATARATGKDRSSLRRSLQKAAAYLTLLRKLPPPTLLV